MTFSTNVPNANQSPGLFPAQMNTDLIRLKAIVQGNHQFNDTIGVPNSDGFHNRVDYINPALAPTIPVGADATGYSFLTNLGTPTNRTETFTRTTQGGMITSGCRAAVSFQGRIGAGACTIHSSYNLAALNPVLNTGTPGRYRITFNFDMPTNRYVIQCTSNSPQLYICEGILNKNVGSCEVWGFVTSTGAANEGNGFNFNVFIFGG